MSNAAANVVTSYTTSAGHHDARVNREAAIALAASRLAALDGDLFEDCPASLVDPVAFCVATYRYFCERETLVILGAALLDGHKLADVESLWVAEVAIAA